MWFVFIGIFAIVILLGWILYFCEVDMKRPLAIAALLVMIAGLYHISDLNSDAQAEEVQPSNDCLYWGRIVKAAALDRDQGVSQDRAITHFLRFADHESLSHERRVIGIKWVNTVYENPLFTGGAPETDQHVAENVCMGADQ